MQHLSTIEMSGVILSVAMLAFGYIGGLIQWLRNKGKESDKSSSNPLENELGGISD